MWHMLSIIPLSNRAKAVMLMMVVSLMVAAFISLLDWVFYPSIKFWVHYQNNLKVVLTVDLLLMSLSFVFMWELSRIIFN